jgi:hypothetical protein
MRDSSLMKIVLFYRNMIKNKKKNVYNTSNLSGFEILTATDLTSAIIQDIMLCNLAKVNYHFKRKSLPFSKYRSKPDRELA